MKIRDIDDIQTQYQALEKAVFAAAMTHLPEHPSKRYAELQEFYCDGDKVRVTISYYGSYSGTTRIELLPDEVGFAEPKVEVEPEEPLDEVETYIAEIADRKSGFVDRLLTVEETDELFEKINAAEQVEQVIRYAQLIITEHKLRPNSRSVHFAAFVDVYKSVLMNG